MPPAFTRTPNRLQWRHGHHVLEIEPWGRDSVRVRAGMHRVADGLPGALDHPDTPDPAGTPCAIAIDAGRAVLRNGLLEVAVDAADGRVTAFRTDTGAELLREEPPHFWWPGARHFEAAGGGTYRIEQRFAAYDGERLHGLGQHGHGRFDNKGTVLDLQQRNGEVTVPFAVSSRGYGFLWNNPAVGRVEFAANGTRWVADRARQIDYWLTAGRTPADILARYADATGRAPAFPTWASGLWQSKLRYRDQAELLGVAREYARRGLPLSVIVVDYLHWRHLGDWDFDRRDWPDPRAMVDELRALGVELAVSVWPSVSPLSTGYAELRDAGLLVATDSGAAVHAEWPDVEGSSEGIGVAFYDATNPAARAALWRRLRENYHEIGIRAFWLDACEPEMRPGHPHNLHYAAGPGAAVANLYPREHARGIHEHLTEQGETEVLSLVRSAWAGSQRYGAALWSGDIPATFEALAGSVRAGLNVAMSGIPWWTTDIGGFHGGDPDDEAYRELMVRWFQFAVFCPLLRLHGHREPRVHSGAVGTGGGPNEIWSYGERAEAAMTAGLHLRERLRPYLHAQLAAGRAAGLPLMRPLLLEFPGDEAAWDVDDAFLCGRDILVAPVLRAGERTRTVYLPSGADWTHHATGTRHTGGQTVTVPAGLDSVPFFLRDDADPFAPAATPAP
ncbi:glycoside hydrolase family 31 protein [Actinacidiphila guanduensis]|uniref:Alpha-D-xyloside xylohydrolase n=1 Tax=Actinacidiphila guanduensis TaxID=310781 RepID=A0A1G9V2C8_9ACTN|nr:TIM-barrel domain-containing protein [Actinacidiphila guanduensis]SDM66207.1 alpha-D-xyloside xylohydrolase [Actinacidiphila guanduensis]